MSDILFSMFGFLLRGLVSCYIVILDKYLHVQIDFRFRWNSFK